MTVSREIDQYVESLKKWNSVINLVSAKSLENVYERHVKDSLQLLNYLDPRDLVVDVGSGAGLPGIILSIGGILRMVLIEADTKKCSFLWNAADFSKNEIVIANQRVEDCKELSCDVLTCRAFTSISKLF
jgi:16S rRNA (guanine527-N7)-methyltransferase